jgi:DNA-binding XRE family transcriptional regulator
MKQSKRKQLEKAGFKIGTVAEFLRLSSEEMAMIELKVRLFEMFKAVRKQHGITQQQLAKLLGSSQSRVAKIESGSPDVSLDLLCKALFAMGVSRQAIGKMISSKRAA